MDEHPFMMIANLIAQNLTGIGKMTITVSTDGTNFAESNISIAENSFASFSAANVEVTGV